MGLVANYKLEIWKKTVENKKCSILLLEEVMQKQLTKKDEDDMDIDVDLNQERGTALTFMKSP